MPQILIVDDSISVRKALELTFKRHDRTSLSAVSGEQALDMLHSAGDSVGLIMADVVMPGMSGLDLCVSVRADARYRHLPLILMSGTIDDALRQQASEVGADGVLRKPFSPEELLPMVEDLLARAPQSDGQVDSQGGQTGETDEEMDLDRFVAGTELDKEPGSSELIAAPSTNQPSPADQGEEFELEDEETGEPAGTPEDRLARQLAALRASPGHEALLVLDAQGAVISASGAEVPAKLMVFLPFYLATSRVLGDQVMGEALHELRLTFEDRDVIVHVPAGSGAETGAEVLVEVRRRSRTLN